MVLQETVTSFCGGGVMDTQTNETVISVKKVSKNFLLPHEKNTSIKSTVVNIFKKKNRSVETQHALKNISFDIKKGEFFGILGRNGSGKSTLLKILAEIYQPTNGSIDIKGKLVPFIELGVGFNPELTGRENVYLNGALLGFSKKEVDARYDDIVEFAELEEFMDQKLKNYSSGMQVRLAFSVATRAEADILLIDEVLAVGDADFQRKCFDYFKSLKKSGKTVIFVTHDMGAVREYCDRAILIDNGVISLEGKSDRVADEYLKLFNDSKSKHQQASDNRWGDGRVVIEKFSLTAKETIKLDVTVRANDEDIDDYVLGYRFYDSEERLVMGGNTLNASNSSRLSLEAGKSQRLIFTIPHILGTGTYTLATTIRSGPSVCDNWDGMADVKVSKSEGYYPIIAPAEMEIK